MGSHAGESHSADPILRLLCRRSKHLFLKFALRAIIENKTSRQWSQMLKSLGNRELTRKRNFFRFSELRPLRFAEAYVCVPGPRG